MNNTINVMPTIKPIENAINYQKCLTLGNSLMAISLIVVFSSLLISYGFDQHFAIGAQVTAHIATIVFAAFIKIGYVMRCIALHAFSLTNF
ncbi:hypothetical protein [Psychromonas sp. Urea-02u-13]|uniref:hypothetical protein n=1 Tax=Psychromonas sp. Urea-02u-13 TaxID=2058326 RepID=UPI0018E33A60|nr:hypothetical protein [Psychromonas sp. Urea-02u-13]